MQDNIVTSQEEYCKFLWEGNHREFVTEELRQERVREIAEILDMMPTRGIFPLWFKTYLPTVDASPLHIWATCLALCGHLLNRNAYMIDGENETWCNQYILILGPSGTTRKSVLRNKITRFLYANEAFSGTMLSDAFTHASLFEKLGTDISDARTERKDGQIILPCNNRSLVLGNYDKLERECTDIGSPFTHGVGIILPDEHRSLEKTLEKSYNAELISKFTTWFSPQLYDLYETKNAGKSLIYKPCLSIFSASTLDWLTFHRENLTTGWYARLLFVPTLEKRIYRTEEIQDEPNQETAGPLRSSLESLTRFHQRYEFTGEVRKAFVLYANQAAEENGNEASNVRLNTYIKKCAMIYAASQEEREITLDCLNRAIAFMDRLKRLEIDMISNHIAFSVEHRNIQAVENFLIKHRGITLKRRDIGRGANIYGDELDKAIRSLLRDGQIKAVPGTTETNRPTVDYVYDSI